MLLFHLGCTTKSDELHSCCALSTSSLTEGLSLHFSTETRSISTGGLKEEEGGTENALEEGGGTANALEEGGTDRRGI